MLLIAPGKPGFPTYHQDRRERAEHIGDRRRLGRPTVEARLQLPATDTNGRTRDRQESAMQTRPATHACTGVFHAQRRGIRPHQSATDHESGAMLSTSEQLWGRRAERAAADCGPQASACAHVTRTASRAQATRRGGARLSSTAWIVAIVSRLANRRASCATHASWAFAPASVPCGAARKRRRTGARRRGAKRAVRGTPRHSRACSRVTMQCLGESASSASGRMNSVTASSSDSTYDSSLACAVRYGRVHCAGSATAGSTVRAFPINGRQ